MKLDDDIVELESGTRCAYLADLARLRGCDPTASSVLVIGAPMPFSEDRRADVDVQRDWRTD